MLRNLIIAAVVTAGILLPTASADAQSRTGLRFGVADDPDSIFIGVNFQTILSGGRSVRVYFNPAIDVGFGDEAFGDFFILRGTAHFEFHFPLQGRRTALFPLIGLGAFYLNETDCPENLDCDYIEPSVDLGGGVRWDRFRFQMWFSADDDDGAPDWNASFGILF